MKTSVLAMADLPAHLASGKTQVVCQTELLIGEQFIHPQKLNEMTRIGGAGYICSVGLGAWGFAFVDYGDKHIINDEDGENTA